MTHPQRRAAVFAAGACLCLAVLVASLWFGHPGEEPAPAPREGEGAALRDLLASRVIVSVLTDAQLRAAFTEVEERAEKTAGLLEEAAGKDAETVAALDRVRRGLNAECFLIRAEMSRRGVRPEGVGP